MNTTSESNMSKIRSYDEIVADAEKAKVAHTRHHCPRRQHVMSEWYSGGKREDKYDLKKFLRTDPFDGDKWDYLTSSDNRDELEEVIRQDPAGRYEIVENGVCEVCNMYEKRKADVAKGKQPSFLIVAYGVTRIYLGPEEGGTWDDATEVLEVRKAYTFEQGLKHARELREEYPQPRYDRHSCANRGEPDIYIRCVYSEADPRMPKDEYPDRTYQ